MNARRRSREPRKWVLQCVTMHVVDELGSRIRETKAAMSTGGLATDGSL